MKPLHRSRRRSLRKVGRRFETRRRPDHPGMICAEGPQCDEPPQNPAPAQLGPQPMTLASMASQINAAMSGPPKAFTWRMPVGEVTLISMR